MSRRIAITAAVILFLALSFELARYLSAPGSERSDVFKVLQAEARGDSAAVVARLQGCAGDAACPKLVQTMVPRLRHSGHVKILLLESGSAYTLSSKTAVTRVAWATLSPAGPTHVQ